MAGSIRRIAFLLNKLLRDNCPSVGTRVYPPGIRQDASYPRVLVNVLTPEQQFAALGTGSTSGVPVWQNYTASLEIFASSPSQCDIVADEIQDAIIKNASYNGGTTIQLYDWRGNQTTVNVNGYFLMNRVTGGSITEAVPSFNAYRRTIRMTGKWLQTG